MKSEKKKTINIQFMTSRGKVSKPMYVSASTAADLKKIAVYHRRTVLGLIMCALQVHHDILDTGDGYNGRGEELLNKCVEEQKSKGFPSWNQYMNNFIGIYIIGHEAAINRVPVLVNKDTWFGVQHD